MFDPNRKLFLLSFIPLLLPLTLIRAAEDSAPRRETPFDDQLLEIAREYRSFGRVDDLIRFAPYLCWMPPPSVGRISKSDHQDSHGRKLYFLYAKNRNEYIEVSEGQEGRKTEPGQALVKEAYFAVPAEEGEVPNVVHEGAKPAAAETVDPAASWHPGDTHIPYARDDEKLFRTGDLKGLFIMFRAEDDAEGTDEGWVYGTVTADGKRVTSAGRVASCMGCHEKAGADRLFGLPDVSAEDYSVLVPPLRTTPLESAPDAPDPTSDPTPDPTPDPTSGTSKSP